jgi:TrfA protein
MKAVGDLTAKIAEMQELARQRTEREPRETLPGAPLPRNVVKLPVWPEPVRGVPNVALRSALFGAIRKGARPYLERQEIHAQDGITIRYTGARLDQGDLDVWEIVLHIARLQALGDECRVTAYQLLKMLGKADTGGNRDVLDRRLARLKATGVEVKVGRYSYMGSLIDEVYKDEDSREYVIRLNPKLRALFEPDQFTQIDWAVRHALDGKPLAQWLHGFYASHAKPYPVKIETLHKLCGSEAKRLTDFKIDLRRNLNAVAEASEAHGQPFSYAIRGDLVRVDKKASRSQRRHLAKKVVKPRKLRA